VRADGRGRVAARILFLESPALRWNVWRRMWRSGVVVKVSPSVHARHYHPSTPYSTVFCNGRYAKWAETSSDIGRVYPRSIWGPVDISEAMPRPTTCPVRSATPSPTCRRHGEFIHIKAPRCFQPPWTIPGLCGVHAPASLRSFIGQRPRIRDAALEIWPVSGARRPTSRLPHEGLIPG
jgi:hypothetical protein